MNAAEHRAVGRRITAITAHTDAVETVRNAINAAHTGAAIGDDQYYQAMHAADALENARPPWADPNKPITIKVCGGRYDVDPLIAAARATGAAELTATLIANGAEPSAAAAIEALKTKANHDAAISIAEAMHRPEPHWARELLIAAARAGEIDTFTAIGAHLRQLGTDPSAFIHAAAAALKMWRKGDRAAMAIVQEAINNAGHNRARWALTTIIDTVIDDIDEPEPGHPDDDDSSDDEEIELKPPVTLLTMAIRYGLTAIATLFIKHGANPQGVLGALRPLEAAPSNNAAMVTALVNAGATPTQDDMERITDEGEPITHDRLHILKLFIAKGVIPTADMLTQCLTTAGSFNAACEIAAALDDAPPALPPPPPLKQGWQHILLWAALGAQNDTPWGTDDDDHATIPARGNHTAAALTEAIAARPAIAATLLNKPEILIAATAKGRFDSPQTPLTPETARAAAALWDAMDTHNQRRAQALTKATLNGYRPSIGPIHKVRSQQFAALATATMTAAQRLKVLPPELWIIIIHFADPAQQPAPFH